MQRQSTRTAFITIALFLLSCLVTLWSNERGNAIPDNCTPCTCKNVDAVLETQNGQPISWQYGNSNSQQAYGGIWATLDCYPCQSGDCGAYWDGYQVTIYKDLKTNSPTCNTKSGNLPVEWAAERSVSWSKTIDHYSCAY